MDYKKNIMKAVSFFILMVLLSSCSFDPKDRFIVIDERKLAKLTFYNSDFNNELLGEYRIDDTIIIFSLLNGAIPISKNKGEKLAGNNWELRVYRKYGSNVLYNVNKITLKTIDGEYDFNEIKRDYIYLDNTEEAINRRNEQKEKSLTFRKFGNDYEISIIVEEYFIRYPMPKDNHVNIILDIELINDNENKNIILIYPFEIKRETKLFQYIGP